MEELKKIKKIKDNISAEVKLQQKLEENFSRQQNALDAAELGLDKAEKEKDQLLIDYARGAATDKALTEVRSRCGSMKKTIEELEEVLKGLEQAESEAENNLIQLQAKLVAAKHMFWDALRTEAIETLKEQAGDQFSRIWVIALLAGGAGRENLLSMILPQPNLEETIALKKQLLDKYQIND